MKAGETVRNTDRWLEFIGDEPTPAWSAAVMGLAVGTNALVRGYGKAIFIRRIKRTATRKQKK